jgi:hypothetical protein
MVLARDRAHDVEDQMVYLGTRGYRCCSTHKDQVNADLLAFLEA